MHAAQDGTHEWIQPYHFGVYLWCWCKYVHICTSSLDDDIVIEWSVSFSIGRLFLNSLDALCPLVLDTCFCIHANGHWAKALWHMHATLHTAFLQDGKWVPHGWISQSFNILVGTSLLLKRNSNYRINTKHCTKRYFQEDVEFKTNEWYNVNVVNVCAWYFLWNEMWLAT